jgi:phosphatidylglycerophosphate synthase
MFNENFLNYALLSLWIVAAFTIFTGFNYLLNSKKHISFLTNNAEE